MSDHRKQKTSGITRYQILMRRIAIAVLVIGLSVSAVVFALLPPGGDGDYMGVYVTSIHNSKKQLLEMERIGGKTAVVAAEINEWFDSLWQGKKLAGTLVVLSVGASLLCFLAGKLPPLDDSGKEK